jgi:anti-sigma regulatory factor (Ser/Thr protein kinase)
VVEPATVGPVELPEVVRRVVREQKLAALARMIAFETQLEPVVVTGDAERLRTIVDNLVSNAIKFSPRSGTIHATLRARDGFAVLDVADEGPGVPAAERERVFDSFFQGTPPAEGRVKGSGLARARRPHRGGRPAGRRARRVLPALAASRDGPARGHAGATRPAGGRRMRRPAILAVFAGFVAGCAAMPGTSPADITLYDADDVAPLIISMTPPMDSPPLEPIEPVEPPMLAPPLMPAPAPAPAPAAPVTAASSAARRTVRRPARPPATWWPPRRRARCRRFPCCPPRT